MNNQKLHALIKNMNEKFLTENTFDRKTYAMSILLIWKWKRNNYQPFVLGKFDGNMLLSNGTAISTKGVDEYLIEIGFLQETGRTKNNNRIYTISVDSIEQLQPSFTDTTSSNFLELFFNVSDYFRFGFELCPSSLALAVSTLCYWSDCRQPKKMPLNTRLLAYLGKTKDHNSVIKWREKLNQSGFLKQEGTGSRGLKIFSIQMTTIPEA